MKPYVVFLVPSARNLSLVRPLPQPQKIHQTLLHIRNGTNSGMKNFCTLQRGNRIGHGTGRKLRQLIRQCKIIFSFVCFSQRLVLNRIQNRS